MVFITFFSIKNSGSDSQTTAIMNAKAVHNGIPATINDLIIGITQAAFAYIGIQISTASGTAKMLSLVMYSWKNHCGIYQWIIAHIHTQSST